MTWCCSARRVAFSTSMRLTTLWKDMSMENKTLILLATEKRASRNLGLFRCVCGQEAWLRMDMRRARFRKCACPPKPCTAPTKMCTGCKIEQPVSNFFGDKNGNPRPRCKTCFTADSAPSRAAYASRHPERIASRLKETHCQSRFGLSAAQYGEKLAGFGLTCNICGNPETRKDRKGLSLDHCHATGKIRGALCNRCNRLIGYAKDSAPLLKAAATYLESRG